MPSPVAHIGAALALQLASAPLRPVAPVRTLAGAIASGEARLAAAAAFASVAPDLDVALALLHPDGLAWHRGPTHSLVGALLIGALVAAVARVRGARATAVVVGAALLHVPFDWSTGEPGAPSRYGVPWAWPFVPERAIAPNPWFGAFRIDEAGFLANMYAAHALPVYAREVGTALGLLVVAGAIRALRTARARGGAPG